MNEGLAAERRTLSLECRADPNCLDSYLAEDFHEYGASGTDINRSGTAARLARTTDPTGPAIAIERLRGQYLADGLVMVKYTATIGDRRSHHTSIWRHNEQGWQMFHHQGTVTTFRPETQRPSNGQPDYGHEF